MLSRVNFGRKCALYHVKLSIAIFFNFDKKKFGFYFLCKMQINLKHHVKSEID